MREKAEYKSAIRSRRLIRNALVELIAEKDLKKITVTDIVTRADINRGTFYAHYQDIRAIFEQIENEIIEKLIEFLGEFEYENFHQNPLTLLLKFSRWIEEDMEFYRILINADEAEQFLVKLKKTFLNYMKNDSDIPEHIKRTPEFLISAHFVAGGVINIFQAWFKNEIEYSLDEMCIQISKIIKVSSTLLIN